ncbi:MAG: hypothetical protein HY077_12315 [Elusimicrobia bacterium]|nr:hypothetical protein [Elusimicrobiota bacterium]
MAEFFTVLRELRAEAGFPSAWAFYKACGPRVLGCTFKGYLYIEKGRSVPQAKFALRIAAGLKIAGDSRKTKRFATAYLRSLLGRKELAELLIRTLSRPPDPHGLTSMVQRASQRIYAGKSKAVTQVQAEVLLSDWRTYWCWIAVSDDVGRWSPARLASALGITAAGARASLEMIVKAGLFAKDQRGRYFCPNAGQAFNFPRDSFYLPRSRSLVRQLWAEMGKRKGRVLFDRYFFLRASEADILNYFPYLAQMSHGARVYAVSEKGPDTAFVAVNATVRRLFPF